MNPHHIVIHAHDSKVARDGSFLCDLFQINQFTVEDKQAVLRSLFNDFKSKRNAHGQADKERKENDRQGHGQTCSHG